MAETDFRIVAQHEVATTQDVGSSRRQTIGTFHSDIIEQNKTVSSKNIGEWRWMATLTLTAFRGVSPVARQVGIALIAIMDKDTRLCCPSEARLAAQLGVNSKSVKTAKAVLKEAGLLTWLKPDGERGKCVYLFNWRMINRQAAAYQQRGKEASGKLRSERRLGGHTTLSAGGSGDP